jgi:hypothetical protein
MQHDTLGDVLARSMFGISATDAIAQRICINCKSDIAGEYQSWGHDDIDEYVISALCPTCFDTMTQLEEVQQERRNTRKLHIER